MQQGYVAPAVLAAPYLILIHLLNLPNTEKNDFYIANLEALGVIDAFGNLLPGGPVITPP